MASGEVEKGRIRNGVHLMACLCQQRKKEKT